MKGKAESKRTEDSCGKYQLSKKLFLKLTQAIIPGYQGFDKLN